MNIRRKFGFIAVISMSAFLLLSCDRGSAHKDLEDYIAKLKNEEVKDERGGAVKIKHQLPPASAKYESDKHRSPFDVQEAAPVKSGDSSNPLQTYPLDMLRFVGTVSQDGKTKAFISAPDNKIYQIKEGDVICDHDSKSISIESDRISLMEQYTEDGGTTMKRVVTLQLKEASQ